MTMQEFKLSIVVPCHNAEKILENTIGRLYTCLNADEELILVENGSTDNTLYVLKRLFPEGNSKNVKVIESPKGLGLAIKYGVEHSRGKTLVFMEDDLPFGLQELDLARSLDATGKYFILSKYHGNIRGLGFRRVQGLAFIFLRELVLKLKVKDSQATFFGDAQIVKELISVCQQKGFLVTLELIAIAKKLGKEVHEIPCNSLSTPIRPTTVKFRDVLQMFIGLFQIKQNLKELRIENF